jgi:transcription antitermination protein NusB
MLNRRTLRIKAMQALYALEQCKEANYQRCLERIVAAYQPDLNSMEPQDKKQLDKSKNQAVALFKKHFDNISESHSEDGQMVELLVSERKFYDDQVAKDLRFFKQQILIEVEAIYSLYIQLLALLIEFADAARAEKKLNHLNFTRNLWIKELKENKSIQAAILKFSDWNQHSSEVRSWFKDVVKNNDTYLAYLDKKEPSNEDQLSLLIYISRKIVLSKGRIFDYFELKDLYWAENKDIVKSLVDKTLKSFNPETGEPMQLQTLSPNWEEDKQFFIDLFEAVVKLEPEYKDLIADNTKNWEVDRLPLTDRVILELAISEALNFHNIPIKVTINEYIELSKKYSTDKSRQFVNGILDVITKKMQQSGSLKKSGRGLIDNK